MVVYGATALVSPTKKASWPSTYVARMARVGSSPRCCRSGRRKANRSSCAMACSTLAAEITPLSVPVTLVAIAPTGTASGRMLISCSTLKLLRSVLRRVVAPSPTAMPMYSTNVMSTAHSVPFGIDRLGLRSADDIDAPAMMPMHAGNSTPSTEPTVSAARPAAIGARSGHRFSRNVAMLHPV
ncbi:hypothetical protein H4R21_003866 [Coemansia helicoidea]|uniref:Uncharacterized protein n=1 Tax=Coemansia helicoidea TaxID=1286919 RepID=A0ACC1L089_9FUNG|nr:hypothetical protein H4R21_003866 [Coemansia helicoidea]